MDLIPIKTPPISHISKVEEEGYCKSSYPESEREIRETSYESIYTVEHSMAGNRQDFAPFVDSSKFTKIETHQQLNELTKDEINKVIRSPNEEFAKKCVNKFAMLSNGWRMARFRPYSFIYSKPPQLFGSTPPPSSPKLKHRAEKLNEFINNSIFAASILIERINEKVLKLWDFLQITIQHKIIIFVEVGKNLMFRKSHVSKIEDERNQCPSGEIVKNCVKHFLYPHHMIFRFKTAETSQSRRN
ncbi:unnamed protein product [Caenorhabditis angaria]|uniref:Uncharacterized protein n=1 Tax=Caenorhabditis angaria TaxID=860376 RepID=A0A9P1N6N0_9PELO|nr:unnamed protein product [Caenorhabditis angaria]